MLQTTQRRGAHLDDVSDDEKVAPNPNPKPEEYQYEARLLRVLSRENLKQRDMIVKEYIEEFYRLDIRSRHVDDEVDKFARYLNGLRYRIQDEISFVKLKKCRRSISICLER